MMVEVVAAYFAFSGIGWGEPQFFSVLFDWSSVVIIYIFMLC